MLDYCELGHAKDNVSWVIGFGMLTVVLAVGLLIFLLGTKNYRKEGPLGSAFTTLAQVFVATTRRWFVDETRHPDIYKDLAETHMGVQPKQKTLARTNQFRFFDKAMIIDNLDASKNIRNPLEAMLSQSSGRSEAGSPSYSHMGICCLMFFAVQQKLHIYDGILVPSTKAHRTSRGHYGASTNWIWPISVHT